MTTGHRPSREDDESTRQLLASLRDGSPVEKAQARRDLAEIFEARDQPADALEMLLTNAREGHRDAELFEALARVYRRLGDEVLATQAALEAAHYRRPAGSGASSTDADRQPPPPAPDGPPPRARTSPALSGGEARGDTDTAGGKPEPPGSGAPDQLGGVRLPRRLIRILGWITIVVLVIAVIVLIGQAPLAALAYAVSAVVLLILVSGWQTGRRALRIPDSPLGDGLLWFAFWLLFLMGGALSPRPITPPTVTTTPTAPFTPAASPPAGPVPPSASPSPTPRPPGSG